MIKVKVRQTQSDGAVVGVLLLVWLVLTGVIAFLGSKLFEFALWELIARDIPWYGDLVGAFFSSPILVPVSAILLILRLAGVGSPLFRL